MSGIPPSNDGTSHRGEPGTQQVYRDTEQVWTGPVVVSVQSRVAMGHVGNSAAVLPLQLAGYEVVDVPTALLSNHPFYPGHRGRLLDAELVGELLTGVAERGVGEAAGALLSGFLGTAAVAPAVARFAAAARDVNPDVRYICDPVLGDVGPGLYVDPGLVGAYRELLVPLADVVTPNVFELELLTEPGVGTVADVEARADALLSERTGVVVVTGAVLTDTPAGWLDTLVVTAGAGSPGNPGSVRRETRPETRRVRSRRHDRHFDGTGDVFSALLTAVWLAGPATTASVADAVAAAVAGTAAVVDRTVADGTKELRLVAVGRGMLDAVPSAVERLR